MKREKKTIDDSDFVEVIRCKDCKHYEEFSVYLRSLVKARYCMRLKDESIIMWTNPMDYCSKAERKKEGVQ